MQTPIKQKALSYFQRGKYKKAQELYTKALNQNRKDPEVAYMLASIYANRKQYDQAINYYQTCLNLQPDAFVALCGLASAYRLSDKLGEALELYEKALTHQPQNPDISAQIASILFAQKKYEKAEETAKKSLNSHPNHPELLHIIGEIYYQRNDIDNAGIYFERALSVQNDRANTHFRLGTICQSDGLFNKSIEHYKSAIAIEPNIAEIYLNLANSYIYLGQLDLAIETLDKILNSSPDIIELVLAKASVYEKKGDIDAAQKLIRPLLEKNILHTGLGLIYLLICNKTDSFRPALQYVDKVIDRHKHEKLDNLLYSAGKACDIEHEYEMAFHYFKKANEQRTDRFSAPTFTAYMDAVRRVFNWEFINHPPATGINDSMPVMIIGMPRSGTSLTEQILDSHPDIFGAGELLDIGEISAELSNRINSEIGFPNALKKINEKLLHEYSMKYLGKLKKLSNGEKFVTDKMPQNYIHLGLISILLPGVKIVHCQRNPVDTCLSIYFQNFNEAHEYSTKLENIACYYVEYMRLMEHWKSVLKVPIFDIKYEDLVADPEEKIRDLLDFIGVEWNDNCLNFHKSKRHVPTASYDQVTQKMYTSSVARWKHYEKHLTPLFNKFEQLGFDPKKYG